MEPIQDDRRLGGVTKKELRAIIEQLKNDNMRCQHRVLALEKGIAKFLAAEYAGEMTNLQKAIQHLERLMGRI
jgi:hypothetical protein